MRQRTPLLEWQIMEDQREQQDAPWPPLVDMPPNTLAARSALYGRYVWRGGIALLLLLAVTGARLWQQAEAGLDQVEAELNDAVQLELASVTLDAAQSAREQTTKDQTTKDQTWRDQITRDQSRSTAAKVEISLSERDHNTLSAASMLDAPDTLPNPTITTINLQNELVVANFAAIAQDGT
jgi:hypothetical protein